MSRIYTFRGHSINNENNSEYYNLKTSQLIQKGEKNHFKVSLSDITKQDNDLKIYGSKEEILEFQEENKILLGNKLIFDSSESTEGLFENKIDTSPQNIHSVLLKPQICDLDLKPPLPFEKQVNYSNIKMPIIGVPKKNIPDVESLSNETIKSLGKFSFTGLHGKGKIISIVNYNTVNLLVYVPIVHLITHRNFKIGKKTIFKCSIITNDLPKGGFFTVIKVKLVGLSKLPKNLQTSEPIKIILKELFKSLNSIVYYHLVGSNKYGRTVAKLYEDQEMKKPINSLLEEIFLNIELQSNIKPVEPEVDDDFIAAREYSRDEWREFMGEDKFGSDEDPYDTEDD